MTTKPNRGRPVTTGTTPLRSIRVPDEEWHAWQKQAAKLGTTVTEWIRNLALKAMK
jgi:hypothetical protein